MRSVLLIAALLLNIGVAKAEEPSWLGQARLFTNDHLGDGQDRWRTGAYSVSFIHGTRWTGSNPDGFGELVEYRVRSEIIAPADLSTPVLGGDRRYVGALHFGAFTHMKTGTVDMSVGLDLVVTGPQTRLGEFQSWAHSALGMGDIQVLGSQIGNAIHPTISAELGKDFVLMNNSEHKIVARPFMEAQAGVETFLRFGGDITFGNIRKGDFQVRDTTTGHRSIAIKGDRARGPSIIVGGDVAMVAASRYLPTGSGYTVNTLRARVRAGVYKENEHGSLFYGLTWLGREFAGQPESQIVGSFSVRRKF